MSESIALPFPATVATPRVEMIDISQRFGDVRVLHDVSLRILPGEVHALAGQNGAGKSTLMKILGGLYPEHDGRVMIDGEEVRLTTPRAALKRGIGMIYQELSLIPTMTVAENVLLGMEPGRGGYSRRGTMRAAREIVERVPMLAELPLAAAVGDLSTGLQQRVEIAKALARDVRVLVMDEPTARLSGPERRDLRALIGELSASGISIVYISHFLEEMFESCSSLTILRNGRVVGQGEISSFTLTSLTRAMLGAELAVDELESVAHSHRESSDVAIIEMRAVSGPRIQSIDLSVRPGEVLGLAGLVGSGRTRVVRTLIGAERIHSGEIVLDGSPVLLKDPRHALKLGIVMLPENRKTEGLIGVASARENMILYALDRGMSKRGIVSRRKAAVASKAQFADLQIRPNSPGLAAERFSGGNQQKILLARALLARPRILIVDQPTAGVDVGTKAQIHTLIRTASRAGTAVIVATDDLDEMLSLADEVVVMKAGAVRSRHRRADLDHTALADVIST